MIKKLIPILLVLSSSFVIQGCNRGEDYQDLLTFHVAQKQSTEGVSRSRLVMPNTKMEYIAENRFFASHADLEHVDVAEITLPDGMKIRGLLFTFNSEGTSKLYRETAANRNGWIIVKEKSAPVGIRKIDDIIGNGELFMLMEYPEGTDLQEKAASANKGIKIIQKRLEDKRNSIFSVW